jgi:ATP-dependent RNA helicase HelY
MQTADNRLTRADVIEKLQRENLLPAITFIFFSGWV